MKQVAQYHTSSIPLTFEYPSLFCMLTLYLTKHYVDSLQVNLFWERFNTISSSITAISSPDIFWGIREDTECVSKTEASNISEPVVFCVSAGYGIFSFNNDVHFP